MRSGIKPRVNEAREFLEIAKDFKDPREIIREALSNSWDAGASKTSIRFDLAPIPGTQRKKIMVEIIDDGYGMSDEQRAAIGSSEIEGFFNLGDSAKPHGSIGSKGHGTKIFYKSLGINLETWKNGTKIAAAADQSPWDTLQKGIVPTYSLDDTKDHSGKGESESMDFKRNKKTSHLLASWLIISDGTRSQVHSAIILTALVRTDSSYYAEAVFKVRTSPFSNDSLTRWVGERSGI